jgi:brefeldin A-resistance guanine nucleotide exchange factor 1
MTSFQISGEIPNLHKIRLGYLHGCLVRSLPLKTVTKIVESLLAQLPEESAPAVIVVKPERPLPSTRANARPDTSRGQYEPGMMYLLELAAILTLRDRQTIESLGEGLLASLQGFIRDARNLHSLALSRVTTYLLNLLRLSHVLPLDSPSVCAIY